MWLIAILAFDTVLNAKVFHQEDWLPYFHYTFTIVLPVIVIYCLIISISEVFFMRILTGDYPFAILVVGKTILQFVVIYSVHFIGAYVITQLMPLSSNAIVNAHYACLGGSLNIFYVIYFFVVSFHFSLYTQVLRKFGSTNLFDIIKGTYFRPKEDERIFMFLDLNESTSIAEGIGHLKYSRFIQRCFVMLTHHIHNYDAEVYQYVGDEAVLTWYNSNNNAAKKSIALYIEFRDNLIQSAAEFEREFGVAPKFKVGISFGTVAIAEVGDYKRDIAFHGTVLNTGARLCQLCKEIKEGILFSQAFINLLSPYTDDLEYVGDFMLTGRKSKEKVYRLLA
jgi:adenylate cyclase